MLPGTDQPATVNSGSPLVRAALAMMYVLVAFGLSRRFPIWSRSTRHVAYYLGLLGAMHVVATGASAALSFLGQEPLAGWNFHLERTFEFILYCILAHGMLYAEYRQQQEREALRLLAEIAESTAQRGRADVHALKMQWSPRFLTETLNSITELLGRDTSRAKRLLVALSSVLRRSLAQTRIDVVRLENEVQFVREVLRVEELRHPGLTVEWVVDEDAWEIPVPHLSLLTLVSSALQGARLRQSPHLRIGATTAHNCVNLWVEAAGTVGHEPDALHRLLHRLYGVGHEFRCVRTNTGLTRVELLCRSKPQTDQQDGRGVFPYDDGAAIEVPREYGEAERFRGARFELATYGTFLLCNTLLALYAAHRQVVAGQLELEVPAWVYVLGSGFFVALWWGSFAAAAWLLSWRYPVRLRRWGRGLLLHGAAALLMTITNGAAFYWFGARVLRGASITVGLLSYWEWGNVAVYVPLAGIAHAFVYAREYQAKHTAELRLRSLLSDSQARRSAAELQVLKAELNPHFLFNALNTISSLMHTRVDQAQRVTTLISTLLRRVQDSGSIQETTVEEEAEFIALYMEIEQARFGDALQMEYLLDPVTVRARVPHLLVQPLVENAVKHGLRPRGGAGRVIFSTRRVAEWLQITIEDDGIGLGHGPRQDGTGTGLVNVQLRLRELYGDGQRLELGPAAGGGTAVTVRIPFSEDPWPMAATQSTLEAQTT